MNTKYTNTVLTIIAVCLIVQIVHSFTQKPIPVVVQAQDRPASPTGTLDVRVVDVTKEIPVTVQKFPSDTIDINIKGIGGDTLSRVGSQVVLPVGVHNTVDVDIKGVDGHLSHVLGEGDGLPVAVLNR